MNFLDMRTTLITYVLISYICTFFIAFFRKKYKHRFHGIGYILLDFLFQSIGVTLSLTRGVLPLIISILLPNILMFSGIIFYLLGIANFIHINIKKLPYLIYSLAFVTLYTYFTYISVNINARILVFTMLSTPIFLHIVYIILFKADENNRKYSLGVALTSMLFIISNILRAIGAIYSDKIESYFTTPIFDTFMIILIQLLIISLTFAVSFMIINKLAHQNELAMHEKEELLKELKHLATTDPLTGISNRRQIEKYLENEKERYTRFHKPFSIILIDIDHFKNLNDNYGHDIGDKSLIDVTKIIKNNLRKIDHFGRFGGEEFLVILPETKLNDAIIVGQKLVDIIADMNSEYLKKGDSITISAGVVEYHEDLSENILTKVDKLLYSAKKNGRNRIEYQKN